MSESGLDMRAAAGAAGAAMLAALVATDLVSVLVTSQ